MVQKNNNTDNIYLVDYENVRKADEVLTELDERDMVCIFYSENCKNISLHLLHKLLDSKVRIECSFVTVGTKNALDFQLASYLGFLIGKCDNENVVYHIVSNDKGFDCICDFWRSKGIDVERVCSVDFVKTCER